jgi:hypothetical protein
MTVETELIRMGVQMKGVLPWLVCWACCASTRDFLSTMAALVGPVNKSFFSAVHYFNSCVPYRPESLAGSRAGSPVSYYESLVSPLSGQALRITTFVHS